MRLTNIIFWLIPILLISSCSVSGENTVDDNPGIDQPISQIEVLDLVCGSTNDCQQSICPDPDRCPLIIALSQPVIFDFVSEVSKCEECNTSDFRPENGIGKCIEYQTEDKVSTKVVRINVSNHCNFKYASPEQVEISVTIDTRDWQITQISPPLQYIQDPTYCAKASDCFCLSGSGVPFIGCSNSFHAPLNWSGYYFGDECGCVQNQCVTLDN